MKVMRCKSWLALCATAMVMLTSCGVVSEVAPRPERKSAATEQGLLKISEASQICPKALCPAGTVIYRNTGEKFGTVVETSPTMRFASGNVKPGMLVQMVTPPSKAALDAGAAATFYVAPNGK